MLRRQNGFAAVQLNESLLQALKSLFLPCDLCGWVCVLNWGVLPAQQDLPTLALSQCGHDRTRGQPPSEMLSMYVGQPPPPTACLASSCSD